MTDVAGLMAIFLCGAMGVIITEAIKFAIISMGKYARQRTKRYTKGYYWIGVIILIAVSGLVTVITLGAGPVKLLTAIQIGINAPALVTAWATASQRDDVIKGRAPSLEIAPGGDDRPTQDVGGVFAKTLQAQAL